MKKAAAIFGFWIAAAIPAMAQAPAPADSITVTEGKVPREVIDAFISSHAAPTQALDQMARWKVPVCPMAVGVPKEFARFVEQRVRAVAAEVGAPVGDASCQQNVSIIFTPEPQTMVNEIRRRSSAFLGYHSSSAQGDKLAEVKHPIQAWHMTGTRDLRGSLEADNGRMSTNTLHLRLPDPSGTSLIDMYLPYARAASVTGGRLGNGLSSEFTHALIVADIQWAAEPEIGTIADAMALLALSRPVLSDACQSMPSILDLLAKDCVRSSETKALSAADLAFLRGLYQMTVDANLPRQMSEVAYQMQQALGGR